MRTKAKKKSSFAGQHENEVVQLVFRQHPIVMRKALLVGLIIILIAIGPLYFWPLSDAALKFALTGGGLTILLWLYNWVGWYYSVYIFTDIRLIEIKQKGFFNRAVREFPLDRIQNVNYHIKGFQAVVFHFGTLTAQTFVGDVVMDTIYKPVETHRKMIEVIRSVNPASPIDPTANAESQ